MSRGRLLTLCVVNAASLTALLYIYSPRFRYAWLRASQWLDYAARDVTRRLSRVGEPEWRRELRENRGLD